ncbi:MAG: hypothetical protein J0H20_21620, partial [Rhizobiales bacterium]|nr:hypothetical protein [Hyphomicrobiales bacterium]
KSLFALPVTQESRRDIAVYVSLSSYSLVKQQTEPTVKSSKPQPAIQNQKAQNRRPEAEPEAAI